MEMSSFLLLDAPRPIQTVLGEIPYRVLGITDAHNHVWIDPTPGADPTAPSLNQFEKIREELILYRAAGGKTLLDCQPGGCGRDANKLAQLSVASGVNIIACTGFHRKKYYSPDHWLFSTNSRQAKESFLTELISTVEETKDRPKPIRAGFIKVALERVWDDTPQSVLEGAAEAALQSGSLVEIHTEQGALAEEVTAYFESHHVAPSQLVLCHMDKRPDSGLHIELARFGVLLEYDTFYRPKYEPETRLWPLINKMVVAGLSDHLSLATDMAEAMMYTTIGNGPGLASLPAEIKSKLTYMGISESSIQQMLGGNIARRLAGLN
jgi:predicted metal-dependent phosphotriesterase family hydrolase